MSYAGNWETQAENRQATGRSACMGYRAATGSRHEFCGRDSPGGRTPLEKTGEGSRGSLTWDEIGSGRDEPMHLLDEFTTAEDALICRAVFSATLEGDHRLQSARTSPQATPLQFGSPPLGDAGGDKSVIGPSRFSWPRPKLSEHLFDRLPRPGNPSQERGVSAPRVTTQRFEIRHDAGAQRIQVDVPHQLQKVGLFFDQNGLVAILKKVALPPMAAIEIAGISGQEPSHDCREWRRASAEEKVNVVWEKCPSKDTDAGA